MKAIDLDSANLRAKLEAYQAANLRSRKVLPTSLRRALT
jgi:hypothetical protein